jgi:Ca-activated chloride channel homolog
MGKSDSKFESPERLRRRIWLGTLGLVPFIFAYFAGAQQKESPVSNNPDGAQQKEQAGFKIGVEVNMVSVPVTVRNREGGFVKDLTRDDFRIFEDRAEQEIVTFAQEAVPTRIAIVLDTSGSVRYEWGTIKFATKKFAENLKPEDQFALVAFNTEIRLKMDWGRSFDRLDPVLSSIYCKDNTNLWDAIWVVSNDVFKGIHEKKAIIIMSDGLDNNSSVSYDEALNAAIRSEAAVYIVSKTEAVRQSMLYSQAQAGVYGSVPREVFLQADEALRKLAYETGGRVLYPNSFGQLNDVYAQVDEELRNQYSLGYISTNQIKDGKYRDIEVRVASPDPVITAKPGYFAPK